MAYVDKAYDGVARVMKDIRDTHIRELLADEFNTGSTYKTGDLVIHDGGLYRFKVDHAAGAWNAAQVDETTIDREIQDADAAFIAALDGTNTTQVFRAWWGTRQAQRMNRYDRLCHFASMMRTAGEDLTYTLRFYNVEAGEPFTMTPMDDLTGKSAAQLCTDATTPVADWADEGLLGGWYTRMNALSLEDGTMNVLAVEGVDDTFDVTGELAPVYTVSPSLLIKKWSDETYSYKSWRLGSKDGYAPYAGDIDPDGNMREITWHPTCPGGLDSRSRLGSGIGQKPANRRSGVAGLTLARNLDPYEGLWNDADTIHVLDMWQLRHFTLGNSGVCEGCQSYNFQYTVAMAETGVKRILLTTAQAANLQVGSNIMAGTHPSGTNNDRGTAANFNIFDNATITSIEEVMISDTTYAAVYVDTDSTFDVPETAFVSTAPWSGGNTENLPGHKDGACHSLTAGQNPMRVMGVEVMDGAYTIGLDPLYNVTNFADGKGDYTVYECKDSTKLAGSVTSNYKNTGIAYTQMPQGWQYVKKFFDTVKAVLFPETIGGSTTTCYKDAFSGTASAGVRCPWRFGALSIGAPAGLACGTGGNTPSYAFWYGRPRLSGSGKKRG